MRTLTLFSLLLVVGIAPALDTPLTLTMPAGETNAGRLVTIDETAGAMRLYEMGRGTGTDALRNVATHNFIIDLDQIRNIRLPLPNPAKEGRDDPDEVFWPLVRIGSFPNPSNNRPTNIPAYGEMFHYFLPNQRLTVMRSDDLFFNEPPPFDGVVRAALSRSYLFIAIPSNNVILVYKILSDTFELVSYRNYRPELYMVITDQKPRGLPHFGSIPEFNQMKAEIQRLQGGDLLLAGRAQDVQNMIDAMEREEDAPEVFAVAKSDPWVAALKNDRFVMIDPPNNKIMLYELPQGDALSLKSLRNMDLDRRIPSWPLPSRDLREFDRRVTAAYMDVLKRAKENEQIDAITRELLVWVREAKANRELEIITPTAEDIQTTLFRKLADQQNLLVGAVTGGVKESDVPYDVVVDPQETLIIDLKRERRLLVYLLTGAGNRIEMRTARDYTIDTGISIYNYEVTKRRNAITLFVRISNMASSRARNAENILLRNIQYLLSIAPETYKALEENRRIRTRFAEHELWQPMITKAMADTEAKQAAYQALIDLVKAEFLNQDAAMKAARDRR